MWSTGLNSPVALFSRAGRVLNDKVGGDIHHHDDFSPVLFKDRAGVTHYSSQTWQTKIALHPGVTNYTGTFTILVFTIAVLNDTTWGTAVNIPVIIIQCFQFGQAVNRVGHCYNELYKSSYVHF